MSAPTGKPLWENPCGQKHLRSDSSETRSMAEMLEPLLLVSNNALTKAQRFSELWVGKIFHSSVDDHHREWVAYSKDWLPSNKELHKSFGVKVPEDTLKKIIEKPLDHTLKLVHKNMQIYAVGLEQAYFDQNMFEDGWATNFREMQIENKQVLCELETVLTDLNDEEDLVTVQRDALTRRFKDTDSSSRNLRDWFILRDFMTNLEYIIELCNFVIGLESKVADSE